MKTVMTLLLLALSVPPAFRASMEIAEELNAGVTTVEWHRRNIRKKLGLVDRDKNLAASLFSFLE